MEKKDCTNMSNSEIKMYLESLSNEFEAKKAKMIEICKELDEIERAYQQANGELQIRKNIYI